MHYGIKMEDLLTVIIRTMPGREQFLDCCLLNLSWQHYKKIELVLVAHTVQEHETFDHLKTLIQLWQPYFPHLQLLTHFSQSDARAHSLNLGLEQAHGRYIAFLDDDDKIYPGHYSLLMKSLQASDYVWAYCDIVRALYNKHGQLISRSMPFRRSSYSFIHHLKNNFIPIHSFILDRKNIPNLVKVDERLSFHEDYDFLLQLAALHPPLYVPGIGAEYCIREDGTNTIISGICDGENRFKKHKNWTLSEQLMQEKKKNLVGWWFKELDNYPIESTAYKEKWFYKIIRKFYLKNTGIIHSIWNKLIDKASEKISFRLDSLELKIEQQQKILEKIDKKLN